MDDDRRHLSLITDAAERKRPAHGAYPPATAPAPIMFPDLATQERQRAEREAQRLGSAARQSEALRAAAACAHERGYDEGYGAGGRAGLFFGALVGALTAGAVGLVAYGMRAWIATL